MVSRAPEREPRDEGFPLADECIHGFDDGLCAICFPPKEPEPRPAAAASRAARAGGSRRPAPSPRVAGAAGARTLVDAPIDTKTLRIYHVTHVDNVGSILGEGAILADAAGAKPAVDVSASDAREFRRSASVEGTDAVVADYVPFLLSTDAHVWNAVRTGTPDPRLAVGAVERQPADHVILVSSVAGAVGARTDTVGSVVVTDADAAAGGVDAASAWPDVLRMLQRLHREDEGSRLLSAEFLVRECLPLERVLLIAVGNDRVRDRVRAALDAVGLRTRVAVYPPWFQPTPEPDAE
ncbi:DarT ssDNA thymidine ADP-ribosyltransferase family protein [Agromyces sp. NPDC058484]|uniref:DarT ssDNA thymidine ADP-ribosyltransferase family protein n=1 Tax=Agromyces sp. NPDC058484 TaxID=3346524 RepID=UPI003656333B